MSLPAIQIPEQADAAVPNFLVHVPSQREYLDFLFQLGLLESLGLAVCGIVFLIYGWKLFKALVLVDAAAFGLLLGYHVGMLLRGENMPLYFALAGALLLGVLAWPLMKYAVSLLGGLAGSLLGYGTWHYVMTAMGKPALSEHAWVGALIGLITLGLLAFIIFKLTIMTFTSFQGSLMLVSGTLALLFKNGGLQMRLHNALSASYYLLPLLLLVPAVIGFALQFTTGGSGKKSKAE